MSSLIPLDTRSTRTASLMAEYKTTNFMFNTLHSYGHDDDFDDFDLDLEPFDEDYPDIGDDFDIY